MYPLFFISIVFPALAALFMISTQLALISLIPILIIPLFHYFIRQPIFGLSLNVQKGLADLSNLAQEHYGGIRLIKSYVVEKAVSKRFDQLCHILIRFNLRLVSLLGMLFPLFTFLTRMVVVLLLLVYGAIVLKAWGQLNSADFLAFLWIQSYIFFPILMLGWILPIYERGRSAYHRLVEVYREPIEVQEGTDHSLKVPKRPDLSFHHLTFRYPGSEQNALTDITLTIPAGSFVGITGPIGSGKSTLFRLLNREYEIPLGMIAIAGHDIRDYPFNLLRKIFITVEQTPFLFSKSVADNIRFGQEDATQIELEKVAELADLHETVLEFPERYETLLGEKGVNLSGGQRQRLALARAFLVKRPILLLDDIFSAVDTATEQKIFSKMKKHFEGRTLLLITHRISILEQMARVLYMQDGRIIEDGSPQDLLQKQGHFAVLSELQGRK
jgi:ATP-binding cassette subfamily B multidrug efflux pump